MTRSFPHFVLNHPEDTHAIQTIAHVNRYQRLRNKKDKSGRFQQSLHVALPGSVLEPAKISTKIIERAGTSQVVIKVPYPKELLDAETFLDKAYPGVFDENDDRFLAFNRTSRELFNDSAVEDVFYTMRMNLAAKVENQLHRDQHTKKKIDLLRVNGGLYLIVELIEPEESFQNAETEQLTLRDCT